MKTKNNTMDESIRLKLVVEGDIQGVGYRALVKYAAKNLKIRGFVRNLPDGAVEIFCEGERKNIDALKEKINIKTKNGGLFSVDVKGIKEFDVKELPEKLETFDIKYEKDEAKTPFEKTNLERLEIGSLILTDFRDSTGSKFNIMENKYGGISQQMAKMESGVSKLTEEFVKSNQTNARLVETLISKLDKVIK